MLLLIENHVSYTMSNFRIPISPYAYRSQQHYEPNKAYNFVRCIYYKFAIKLNFFILNILLLLFHILLIENEKRTDVKNLTQTKLK